jgi:GNAT superfamily N-acetyltransferase
MDEGSLERVRDAWRQVLGAPDAFRGPGTVVVARPARPAPGPRWVTVVTLGDARCVLLPADLAARLDPEPGRAVTGGSGQAEGAGDPVIAGRLAHPDEARALLGPGIVALGPAVLAFTANLAPSAVPSAAEPAEPGAADLDRLGAACDPGEAAESALAAWTHWVHVIRERDLVVAAAGAQVWAGTLAHLGALTRPDRRGRGLGATVASSVVRAALATGLVAQWRARTELTASRRLAAGLGFVELGQQVSYQLPDPARDRGR